MKRKCVIIAGEMSADVLGSDIISSNKNIDWYGIGGPYMKQKKMKSILSKIFIISSKYRKVVYRTVFKQKSYAITAMLKIVCCKFGCSKHEISITTGK